MTIVSICSLKGAPGVTTLSCLVAATWPAERRVVLVEGDPSGGDLAARFRLSSKRGWSSYAAASRRLEGIEPLAAHVQQLPGGQDVIVGTRFVDPAVDRRAISSILSKTDSGTDGNVDLIIDVGRLLPGELGVDLWLERSAVVAIALRRDAASILHARDRVAVLRSHYRGRLGLVVVGPGPHPTREIERFTETPVLGEVPEEPQAARIAGGHPGGPSRLSRSPLVLSSRRLAETLCEFDRSAVPARKESVKAQGFGEPLVGLPVDPDERRLLGRLKTDGHGWRLPWAVTGRTARTARAARVARAAEAGAATPTRSEPCALRVLDEDSESASVDYLGSSSADSPADHQPMHMLTRRPGPRTGDSGNRNGR